MGTHPIFESDFDCLTEIGKNEMSLDGIRIFPESITFVSGWQDRLLTCSVILTRVDLTKFFKTKSEIEFKNGNEERSLQDKHSGVIDSGSDKIKCLKCDYKVPKKNILGLIKHIRVAHGRDSVTRFRLRKSKFLPLRCCECQYCFTKEEALTKHFTQRCVDKPWYTKCDRFGKNVRKMYKHENMVKKMKAEPINNIVINFLDVVRGQWRCPIKKCSYRFDDAFQIIEHIKLSHSRKEFFVFITHPSFSHTFGLRYLFEHIQFLTHSIGVNIANLCT